MADPGLAADLSALLTSVRLALVTTLVLLLLGTPLAWWLATGRSRLRPVVEALASLPLVLPPTVLGFYLLLLLGPSGPLGHLAALFGGGSLAFSFTGLVIGSCIYSLPFVVQPLSNAFRATGTRVLEVGASLRASPRDAFFSLVLPLSRRGYLSAAVLTFAHTLGEFGVILMIGGNIPGRTQVASIALFRHVELLEYGAANRLALILLLLCTSLLLLLQWSNRHHREAGVAL